MHYFVGIDIGSTMTKVAIMDESAIVSSIIGPTGPEHRRLAYRVMEDALVQAGLVFEDLTFVVATGYGRINVPFADRQVTEITCHAKGIHHLLPTARTVVDVGGQDSKGIKILGGKVIGFVMNDKCAARHGPVSRGDGRCPWGPPGPARGAFPFRGKACRDQQYLHGFCGTRSDRPACKR